MMNKSRLFLITGGSGFLGINLIHYLLKKGERVVSLDIVPFDYPDVKNKITAMSGDIRNKKDVEKAIKGVDVVVHCAAALPLYKKEDIFSTDITGTKNVIDICTAIYLAANADKRAANDTYNIGAREFTTMKEDYQAVLSRIREKNYRFARIPGNCSTPVA